MSEAIAASLSLDEVLATVGDTALHEIHGDLVSTWLDDGEGGYFERQRLLAPKHLRAGAMQDAATSARSIPSAFVDHFAQDTTLLEHGPEGACASSRSSPSVPVAVAHRRAARA